MKWKFFEIVVILAIVLCATAVGKTDVVINEAMINPDAVSDTYGEWVELYNNADTAVDINEWVIKDADSNYHLINNGGALFL